MSKIKHEPGDVIILEGAHYQVTQVDTDDEDHLDCSDCDANNDANNDKFAGCGILELAANLSCNELIGHKCLLKRVDPLVVLIQKIQEEEDVKDKTRTR